MIKDKITPELKNRFREDTKISRENGKERGFFLCEDKNGKLIPSKSCEGTECEIRLGDPRTGCPTETKTYGEFHTHPYFYSAKIELKERGEKIPPEKELRDRFNKNIREAHEKYKVKGMTISSPSYTDVIRALLGKAIGATNGTVCTSTDVEPDKVECWTIKDMDIDKLKIYATYGMKELKKVKPEGSDLIQKWIENISEREIIDLK